ncbi:hypothetical protein HDU79_007975 [Rhizoclosmatium sp. JEL0117]|nr:hypothetical protein HDU79_007975 [Rhizoclosmatium sp. JEL0117]
MASTTLLPFESYYGAILNRDDVTLLVEACIAGLATSFTTVPRKVQVRSGSVVAFREREDGARWRDSNRWSPSKVQGCFLQYQEVEVGPWGKRIKTDGLIKRTLTVIGSDGGRWRVIGYFRQKDLGCLERVGSVKGFSCVKGNIPKCGAASLASSESYTTELNYEEENHNSTYIAKQEQFQSNKRMKLWDEATVAKWNEQPPILAPLKAIF